MSVVQPVIEPQMPKSWNRENKPHKFCPGCGHGMVLKALGEVIDELGIQRPDGFRL